MTVDVYLNFNGNCREAAEFYAEVFRTEKPQIMTYGETASSDFVVPEEAKDLVLHTRLNISGSNVMFSDVYPGHSFVQGNNISLAVVSQDMDEVKSTFAKLSEGGTVEMDLQETFWSKCYGSLKDKFGIEWQMSHESKEV